MNTTTLTMPIGIEFQIADAWAKSTGIRPADDLETAHSRIAHEWYEGLGLEYAGVDLGDGMTYDVLRVIGRLLVRDRNNGVSKDPVPPEGPSDAVAGDILTP